MPPSVLMTKIFATGDLFFVKLATGLLIAAQTCSEGKLSTEKGFSDFRVRT